MATYYADTSVLIKRHSPEIGSEWVTRLTDPSAGHLIIAAEITLVEGMSAFNRRLREGALSAAQYSTSAEDWELVCNASYQLIALSSELVGICRRLLETYPLRAYDAVQLATAVGSNQALIAADRPPLVFLSADKRLLDAARGEGLDVDDPNQHP